MTIVEGLVAQLLPSLGAESGEKGGIAQWLRFQSFAPTAMGANQVFLKVDDYRNLIPFLSAEYERFALAAAQSFSISLKPTAGGLPQTSWRLLMLYYGAFFSAHAISRAIGSIEMYLNRRVIARANEIISLYDTSYPLLDAGPYSVGVEFSGLGAGVGLRFTKPTSRNGAHDVFWRSFCRNLASVAERAVEEGLPDSASLVAVIERISGIIRFAGTDSGTWLSQIRNDLNYQHLFDAWYPQSRHSKARVAEGAIRLGSPETFRLDFSREKEPIQAFGDACNYLCSVNFALANQVAAKSTRGGAFGQKWRRLVTLAGNLDC